MRAERPDFRKLSLCSCLIRSQDLTRFFNRAGTATRGKATCHFSQIKTLVDVYDMICDTVNQIIVSLPKLCHQLQTGMFRQNWRDNHVVKLQDK